jgi:hypothetical protein
VITIICVNQGYSMSACQTVVKIDCMGFFEEIVRRIEVTFRMAQTQVKAERERYSNLIIVLILQRKKGEKEEKKKGEKKHTMGDIYSKY